MQVQAVVSAPGDLAHQLSKRNLRRKDVYLMGVLWETADYICTNQTCSHVVDGPGNYRTNLEKGIERLRAENERLRAELQRAISLPTATEAARNVALEKMVDWLRDVDVRLKPED